MNQLQSSNFVNEPGAKLKSDQWTNSKAQIVSMNQLQSLNRINEPGAKLKSDRWTSCKAQIRLTNHLQSSNLINESAAKFKNPINKPAAKLKSDKWTSSKASNRINEPAANLFILGQIKLKMLLKKESQWPWLHIQPKHTVEMETLPLFKPISKHGLHRPKYLELHHVLKHTHIRR
jgi:hypothetical protein